MRIFSILRTATVALTLVAAFGTVSSSAFAASRFQAQQATNASPYDSPDFVVPPTNIEP